MQVNFGPGPIRLRIVVVNPPAGVEFAVQSGRTNLIGGARTTDGRWTFDVGIAARVASGTGAVILSGPVMQGPAGGRFIYVNSGVRAGQAGSCWDRRAKVPLTGIDRVLLDALAGRSTLRLAVSINGQSADGGPACGSVQLLGRGWLIEPVDGSG